MIYVVDELVARPGKGRALHDAYLASYAPGAETRGMTLRHRFVEPAMWLPEGSNRLLFIWSVPDVRAVWGAKQRARLDPQVDDWWEGEAAALIERRERYTVAEAEALEGLADV